MNQEKAIKIITNEEVFNISSKEEILEARKLLLKEGILRISSDIKNRKSYEFQTKYDPFLSKTSSKEWVFCGFATRWDGIEL